MTFRDRWLRRADDARRTKGDPPPTYAQLMAEIRQTQAALALAEQIATNLRHQCDGLERENARLRLAGAEKSEYVEALALELAQVKKDGICGHEAPLLIGTTPPLVCVLRQGHASEWHEDDNGGRWRRLRVNNPPGVSDKFSREVEDPDPARPYIKSPEATT